MASKPYLRAADDGTYELVVPSGKGRLHVLPYCFHTEEDALSWLSTRKGREHIKTLLRQERRPASFPAAATDLAVS
jgi:hypothetical protein